MARQTSKSRFCSQYAIQKVYNYIPFKLIFGRSSDPFNLLEFITGATEVSPNNKQILVIMIFRDRNSNIFKDFKRFFESKTWNYVLYGDFYEEKMCLTCNENRESGPTAFQMVILEYSNSRKNWLSHFPRTL